MHSIARYGRSKRQIYQACASRSVESSETVPATAALKPWKQQRYSSLFQLTTNTDVCTSIGPVNTQLSPFPFLGCHALILPIDGVTTYPFCWFAMANSRPHYSSADLLLISAHLDHDSTIEVQICKYFFLHSLRSEFAKALQIFSFFLCSECGQYRNAPQKKQGNIHFFNCLHLQMGGGRR